MSFLNAVEEGAGSREFQNVDSLIGQIIGSGKATLHELRTIYTLEDAFIMWESVIIPKYNEYIAAKRANAR